MSGVSVSTSDRVFKARAAVLLCSVDLRARALVSNTKQYNGQYGCLYCESPGQAREQAPAIRDWPYEEDITMRSHDSIKRNALMAVRRARLSEYSVSL